MKSLVLDNAPKRIKLIQFGILSPQEIVAISEYESTQRDLYAMEGLERVPAKGGVLDRRLGTSDKSSVCDTCGHKMAECHGHYSYIRLVLPVFHIGYFKQVITMLQDICKTCSRVLLSEEDRRLYLTRFRRPHLENVQRQLIAKAVNTICRKVIYCPYCGAVNGTVKKVGALRIVHEKYRGRKMMDQRADFEQSFRHAISENKDVGAHLHKAHEDMNPLRVLNLFKKISPADCELLGLDPQLGRPEEFIWQYLSVPPVCIRPSVTQEAATNEDDVTVKLAEIVLTNSLIKTGLAKGQTASALMEQWDFLQVSVAVYINADHPGVNTMAGSKPIRGFCQRLKGKQGRFRGNLSGKRVDFSGRTVISPDPNLRIDQVAVPMRVAKILTYPDIVNDHNIHRLRQAVINGADIHPGANYVTMGGFKKFLKFGKRQDIAAKLSVGDVVERHLRDDDVILFNRQPSLHKLSIMSHRAKIRPWRTFRLNECVCTPYNADFDGDEMNLHVPQTEEARIEAIELMNVKNNLVTPRNGEPIIAATQDFITASYLLTRRDRFFTRQQFCQAIGYFSDAMGAVDLPHPAILKPEPLWTGKQVFHILIKPNKKSNVLINLEGKCKTLEKGYPHFAPDMSPNDGYVVMVNSEIMCGVMDKSFVGDGNKNSVFGIILRDYGPHEAAAGMGRLAKFCARWLTNYGFSIGISDVTPGDNLRAQKETLIEGAYEECQDLIRQSASGKLQLLAGLNTDETLEASISGLLSRVRDKLGETCMTELSRHNAPLIMATCGSKGSKINVSQMVACVGQQIISGHRVPNGFQDRSLPHFPKKSKDPPSKGFVRNSFYTGLVATEFLFHAVSGREGLVDTAVKTAETGYMQRRLMKALEDLSTRYDLSVRNAVGGVVQFTFGDDGLDPVYLEDEKSPVAFGRTWKHAVAITPDFESRGILPFEITQQIAHALKQPRFANETTGEFRKSVLEFISEKVVKPAANYRQHYGLYDALEEPMDWDEEIDLNNGASAANIAVVDNKTKVTKKQVDTFINLCWTKYMKAKVEPGTAVGAIGAQSIGEPGTQMTLKTFHFAGVAAMNVTLGVPRIKEIINASKTINTPQITAKLVAGKSSAASESAARIVKGRIEKTYLKDISTYMAPSYESQHVYLCIQIDFEAIAKLQLDVTLESISASIAAAPKLKIKIGHIRIDSRLNRILVEVDSTNDDTNERTGSSRMALLYRKLPDVVVKGVAQCSRAVIQKQGEEVMLVVEGNGLQEVMTTEGVIGTNTVSNHIIEVFAVLGIEAARKSICDQIAHTMSSHGLTVDPRHTMLLGDVMCYKGEVLGITRFGVARLKDSTLMLASFEKTTDHLFDAAIYGKRDAIDGISEAIILGMPSNNLGTSMPALVAEGPVMKTHPPRRLIFDT